MRTVGVYRSTVKQSPSWPLLNMPWSASNYCFSARFPAQERLWSHSNTAQGSSAASVLLRSRLGLQSFSALWAGLLVTNDGLSPNGIANFASSANNFEWSWSEIPSASTDRIWQDLIISSVFPLSVNSEVCPTRLTLVTASAEDSRGSCGLAAVPSVCWWHSALWLFFSRSRWCDFPFYSEPGQNRGMDENQLADNLARGGAKCKVRGDGQ